MADAAELREWLAGRVAALAGLPASAIDADRPFAELGLDSAGLATLSGELEVRLGRALDPALAFEYPTVAQLAARLAVPAPARGAGAAHGDDRGALAIVGLACRMPGAPDLAAFWDLLDAGRDAVREVPPERWDWREVYDPTGAAPGRANTRWGGFLDDVDRFDAAFFRISPAEAARMDPQQRLLLETAWEAFEDAGEVPNELRGGHTGVFVGISVADYATRQLADLPGIGPYTGTGNALALAANRLSYVFDLHGPSIAVDTACSSSLVAAHLACRALRAGDCERALVGGVNLTLDPEVTIGLSRAGMLAPDGRCKPFDARANGYVRGEGCGVAVVKPLAAALAAGDRVYAVIRGSAVNQDGASNGLTAPHPGAQRAVIEAACRDAGVDPAAMGYVECHGTGTLLGDPIEASALGAVVGAGRDGGAPCLIGSVKSNVGHLESAAGIAGLIKVALSLERGRIPRSLHFETPNPKIRFDELGLRVAAQPVGWSGARECRLASVSSFGFGGTNAHVVLQAAPAAAASKGPAGPVVLPISARSRPALERLVRDWGERLAGAEPDEAAALAFTGSVRRTHHRPLRVAVVGDAGALAGRLADPASTAERARPGGAGEPRVAFVYSGQGAQWQGMARELLADEPLFASSIRRCDEELRGELDWSVERALRGEEPCDLADTERAQPLLAAIQIALTDTWRAYGIEPAAVAGHSVGEVAAAFAAGLLDRDAALRLAARRGRAMAAAAGRGEMLAVPLARAEAAGLATGAVALAAVNGPRSAVLSGPAGELARVAAELAERGTPARRLDVGYAFHSPLMEPAAATLRDQIGELAPRAGRAAFHSTVLGRRAHAGEVDAGYWARGVRDPVEFAAAIGSLLDGGADVLVEIGPRPVLRGDLRALAAGRAEVLHTLDRDGHDRLALLTRLATLYELGCSVRWRGAYPNGGAVASMPTHPWERRSHWIERPRSRGAAPWPGARLAIARGEVWETAVGSDVLPCLADHRVGGAALLPAAAYVELATATGRAELSGLTLRRALDVGGRSVVQTSLGRDGDLAIHARPASGGDWTLHATARALPLEGSPAAVDVAAVEARCPEPIRAESLYASLAERGLDYGNSFRGIAAAAGGDGEAIGRLVAADAPASPGSEAMRVLDAAIQLVAVAAGGASAAVPAGIEKVRWWSPPPAEATGYARITARDGDGARADVTVLAHDGAVAVELAGVQLRRVPAAARAEPETWLYETRWRDQPLPAGDLTGARWLVLGDGGLAQRVSAELGARGATVIDEPAAAALDGVLCLWPLDRSGAAGALLDLLRELASGGSKARLVVVTRGAQPARAAADVADPAAAAVWGLLKAVPHENPLQRVTCVDLDRHDDGAAQLVAELAAHGSDDEVAYRDGRRLARRIVAAGSACPRREASTLALRPDAAYLVTGGLGALGLRVAARLVERGARHIALMSRTAHPDAAERAAELRADGAEVAPLAVDVADRGALDEALTELRAGGLPLAGVVHAAGVLDDRALLETTPESLATVLAPKLGGALNLHELTRDDPLDWFVLFSSAAATLGSPGQAAYCAANACLDALAHHRRGIGLPASSLAWGPWDAGMAADGLDRRLASAASVLDPADALALFERLAAGERAHTVVLPFDLRNLLQFYPAGVGDGFFRELATEEVRTLKSIGGRAARPDLATDYVAPRGATERRIAGIWRRSLAIEPIGVLDRFFDLGGDSVFGNQILVEINRALGVAIDPGQAFGDFTVAHLAELAEEQMVARLERMSDAEAEQLLRSGG